MRKYTIEDTKRLITDFCETEYGTENKVAKNEYIW